MLLLILFLNIDSLPYLTFFQAVGTLERASHETWLVMNEKLLVTKGVLITPTQSRFGQLHLTVAIVT